MRTKMSTKASAQPALLSRPVVAGENPISVGHSEPPSTAPTEVAPSSTVTEERKAQEAAQRGAASSSAAPAVVAVTKKGRTSGKGRRRNHLDQPAWIPFLKKFRKSKEKGNDGDTDEKKEATRKRYSHTRKTDRDVRLRCERTLFRHFMKLVVTVESSPLVQKVPDSNQEIIKKIRDLALSLATNYAAERSKSADSAQYLCKLCDIPQLILKVSKTKHDANMHGIAPQKRQVRQEDDEETDYGYDNDNHDDDASDSGSAVGAGVGTGAVRAQADMTPALRSGAGKMPKRVIPLGNATTSGPRIVASSSPGDLPHAQGTSNGNGNGDGKAKGKDKGNGTNKDKGKGTGTGKDKGKGTGKRKSTGAKGKGKRMDKGKGKKDDGDGDGGDEHDDEANRRKQKKRKT